MATATSKEHAGNCVTDRTSDCNTCSSRGHVGKEARLTRLLLLSTVLGGRGLLLGLLLHRVAVAGVAARRGERRGRSATGAAGSGAASG